MKHNRILLALAILLAAALGLWYGPRLHRGALAGSLPELLNYAPGNSTVIFYADAAALRAAPVLARFISSAPPANLDKDYEEFVRATGFDFRRDLDRVLVAVRPAPAAQTLIFADGRFDRGKIVQYAQHAGKLENRNGRAIYVLPSTTPNKKITLTFLEGGRVAISDGGDIAAALTGSGDAASAFDAAMRERISRVAGSPAFAVMKTPPPSDAPASNQATLGGLNIFAPFQNMRWASFAAQPDAEQILVSAEGECGTPAEAVKAQSALEFMRIVVGGVLLNAKASKMTPEQASAVSNLIQSIKISSDGIRVRLLVALTPRMLDSFSALAPAAKPAQAGASAASSHR